MSRSGFVLSVLFVTLGVTPSALGAQRQAPDSVRLDELVVSVSREAVRARLRAAAADLVDQTELGRRQIQSLPDALRLLPGSTVVGTGGRGGTASTFLRGVNSNQTLLLIDGIRVNDGNADPGALLGGFEFSLGDRLEVARGPQSTQFGGAAIGGVVSVAGEVPSARGRFGLETEAGSFATYRARGFGSIRTGRLGLAAGGSFFDTENERPDNQADQRTQYVRLELQARPTVMLGATFRGLQQSVTSPGDVRTSNTTPVGLTTFENNLGTAFLDAKVTRQWASRLTLGGQGYFLRGSSRFNGGDEFVSRLKSTRWVVDWQQRVALGSAGSVIAGVNAEWSDVRDNDGPKDERLRAGYAEVAVTPTSNLHLTAGGRHDDYTTFGARTTGRVAAGWFVPAAGIKLRATYGTGFMPPSLAARYGSAFQKPNRDLRPERSRGVDVGIDRFFARGRAVASLTWFRNDLRDLIAFEFGGPPDFLGQSVNISRARTSGVELSSRAELGAVDARVAYTYLDTENLTATTEAERRLIRRPKHALSGHLTWSGRRVVLGAGVAAALDREDSDFNVFPAVRVDPGNFVDARLHAEWRFSPAAAVRARVDNVFDERYEEAYGFPALGRRLTIGLAFDRIR